MLGAAGQGWSGTASARMSVEDQFRSTQISQSIPDHVGIFSDQNLAMEKTLIFANFPFLLPVLPFTANDGGFGKILFKFIFQNYL